MNKFITMMIALAATLFAINSFAWDPPASPAPASWISDSSGALTPEAHQRLDAKLAKINQSSANELAALIVPTLDGQDISDVTNATFKAWGVGKKGLDNGVLVVLAMKEHKSRIETGKGVEGDLPDLKTQDILNNVVRPYMRNGDIEGALGNSFDAIAASIANHKADVAAGRNSSDASCDVSNVGVDHGGNWALALVVLGAFLWLASSALKSSRRRKAEALQRKEDQLRKEEAERKLAVEARQKEFDEAATHRAKIVADTAVAHVPATKKWIEEKASVNVRPAIPRPTPRVKAATPTLTEVVAEQELEAQIQAQRERNRRSEERAAEARQEQREEERRRQSNEERRRREEEDDSSNSSSSSSFDWSGSSDDSGGGDFGGGDSGGGGSSSDW